MRTHKKHQSKAFDNTGTYLQQLSAQNLRIVRLKAEFHRSNIAKKHFAWGMRSLVNDLGRHPTLSSTPHTQIHYTVLHHLQYGTAQNIASLQMTQQYFCIYALNYERAVQCIALPQSLHLHVHLHVQMYACTDTTHTYTNNHTHIHTYTHILTYIQIQRHILTLHNQTSRHTCMYRYVLTLHHIILHYTMFHYSALCTHTQTYIYICINVLFV